MLKKGITKAQVYLDQSFLKADRKHILRSKNILRIPGLRNRRGGKVSYAEWAHVIGIFQSLFYQNLVKKTGNQILDIGCGTGLLAISSEPFIQDGGLYTGIDVRKDDVEFCQKHYRDRGFEFIHFNVQNATYAADQDRELKPWPVSSNSMDLVCALSVWTHLSESDAKYYFKEMARVLKPGGKAVISFFYLDDLYEASLEKRSETSGRYHNTNQNLWVFDQPAYDSDHWFSPGWVKEFEDAIGLDSAGMKLLLTASGLSQIEYYPGNWKEIPGIFFQDVFVFEKS